jgi:ligand-binding sensor domain-containing protein
MFWARIKIKFLVLLFMLLISFKLKAQNLPVTLKQFGTREGIVDLDIHCIQQDTFKRLWLGTATGLFLYDGMNADRFIKNETLSHSLITCIYKEYNKGFWIGTFSDGLFFVDESSHIVSSYSYAQNNHSSISANRIHAITGNNEGKIIIATEKNGIDIYDSASNSFTNIKPADFISKPNYNKHNTILSMQFDPKHEEVIWLGTLDGLFKYDLVAQSMDFFQCQTQNTSNPAILNTRENIIKSLFCTNDYVYAGSWGGGLSLFDKKRKNWTNYKFESPFPATGMRNDVVQIKQKSQNELWIIAYQQELGIFNTDKGLFSFHGYKNIRTMFQTPSDGIWFGTIGNGLFAWFPPMEYFKKIELPFSLTKIIFDENEPVAYAGIFGESSLLKINLIDNQWEKIPFIPAFDKEINFISDLQFDQYGGLYLLGQTAVYKYDRTKRIIKKIFSPFDMDEFAQTITSSTCFLIDNKDILWYATKFNGLLQYNTRNGKFIHYGPDMNEGYTAWISELFQDKEGNVWYGSGKGFGYYSYRMNKFTTFENSLQNTFPDSLSFTAVTSVEEDQNGNLWIGSLKKGLGKYRADQTPNIKTFTSQSAPMIDDVILDIKSVSDNYIWLLTKEGLSRYQEKTDSFEHFSTDFGLRNIRSISVSPRGEPYFTTTDGFYLINKNIRPDTMAYPEIYIKDFKVFNHSYSGEKAAGETDTLFLDHKQNFITVDYGAISYNYPHLTKFRHKLEGLHDNWIFTGQKSHISFSNLDGGSYHLYLSAGYGNGLYGQAKKLTLIVEPPLWKKTWFWLLNITLILLIVYFVIDRRIKNIKKKLAIKAAYDKRISEVKLAALQSQMNPHFLFNCLNSIKLLSLENKAEEASDYLTRFSKLIRNILNSSKLVLVSLTEELETLRLYLEMESLRFDHEFSFVIRVDSQINKRVFSFPPMMVQVFVENAIKHGLRPKKGDKKLDISFKIVEDQFVCEVIDNGIGREAAKFQSASSKLQKESMGIKNIRERLDHLKKVHDLDSCLQFIDLYEDNLPTGTLVKLSFPVKALLNKSAE